MISGRGLGHTGGTLDKLASIPGYDVAPDLARFRAAVREAGCAIVGQTAELAPADRRLYAIRDVTATVESVPLITASILSKKLAAGLDALVMDVKVGSGAFAGSLETAQALAESLVMVAGDAGLQTVAWLTDMNQALGHDVGNALEVAEAIDFLTGRRREGRLHASRRRWLARCSCSAGSPGTGPKPPAAVARVLASGAAAERFARMVVALGGPPDLLEHPERHLPRRRSGWPSRRSAPASSRGWTRGSWVSRWWPWAGAGAGPRDAIDPAVGLADVAGLGDAVGPDRPLAGVHARSTADAQTAALAVRRAITVSEAPSPVTASPVLQRIAPSSDRPVVVCPRRGRPAVQVAGLPGYLWRRLDGASAAALVAALRVDREVAFLNELRQVFDTAASPYRALLQHARCEYTETSMALTRRDGVETALATLYRAGVYLTVDEFKVALSDRAVRRDDPARPRLAAPPWRRDGADLLEQREPRPTHGGPARPRRHSASRRSHGAAPARARRRILGPRAYLGRARRVFHSAPCSQYALMGARLTRWFLQVDPRAGKLPARYRWSGRAARWASLACLAPLPSPQAGADRRPDPGGALDGRRASGPAASPTSTRS